MNHASAHIPNSDRWSLSLGMSLAAVALGYAIQLGDGTYSPAALGWLTAGLVCAVAGLALPKIAPLERIARRWMPGVFLVGLILQSAMLHLKAPAPALAFEGQGASPETLAPFILLLDGLIVLAAAGLSLAPAAGPLGRKRPWLMLALFGLCGLWILRMTPNASIDVFSMQQESAEAMLQGRNPYAITLDDPYDGRMPEYYGPGMTVGGRLQFGLVYVPMTLWLDLPAYWIARDVRYGLWAALLATGALMIGRRGRAETALLAPARPGRELAAGLSGRSDMVWIAPAAAAMLLLTPRVFLVLRCAWTEPMVLALLAAVVAAAMRRSPRTPWLLGLLLASKQYAPPMFVLALVLLMPRPWRWWTVWAWTWRAGTAAMAATLPMVLWDPSAFWHSAVTFHLHQPFRTDALSYAVWWLDIGGDRPGAGLGFLAMALGMALSLWRCPRTPAGFAAAVAMTYFPFFAFNQQAFANYYFLIIGAMWLSVAAMCADSATDPPIAAVPA